MMRQYIGRLGEGKTTFMIYDAWQFLTKENPKYRIVTNQSINIRFKKHWYSKPKEIYYPPTEKQGFIDDLMTGYNTLYLIDEIHLIFPNKEKLSLDLETKLAYMRKYGNAVLYTCQGYNHVHKRIRDLTNEVCRVSRTYFNPFWAHVGTFYDPESFDMSRVMDDERREKGVIYRRYAWRWVIKKIYRSFDTLYTTQTQGQAQEFKQPTEIGVIRGLFNGL